MFHTTEVNETEMHVNLNVYLVLDLVVFDWSVYGDKIANSCFFRKLFGL